MGKFLPETETTAPIIRGPGEGKVVGVLRDQSTFKVMSEETGGAYAILEQKIPPGHGPPLHVHRHETEIFYVLEGQFEITVGEQCPLRLGRSWSVRATFHTRFATSDPKMRACF